MIPSSIRTSKRSGELTLQFANSTGSAAIASSPPKTIAARRRQSAAAARRRRLARPHAVGHPDRARARARGGARRAARRSGSSMLRPGVSIASVSCTSRRRSSRVGRACRRAARPARSTNGGPWTAPKSIASPPTSSDRAGYAGAQREASAARAPPARAGSRGRSAPSGRRWSGRPRRKCAIASGWSNCTPTSAASRSTPRSIVSSASSESGSKRGMRFVNMHAP